MVILHETGRIPVETHSGTNEFGMIDEARAFEHSGPYFALLKWGSELKQLILFTILADVFLARGAWRRLSGPTPSDWPSWRCWPRPARSAACGGHRQLLRKLRLFKITEYVSAAFLMAVLGVFTLYLGGG